MVWDPLPPATGSPFLSTYSKGQVGLIIASPSCPALEANHHPTPLSPRGAVPGHEGSPRP